MTLSKSHTREAHPAGLHSTAVPANNQEDRDVMPHEVLFEHRTSLMGNNARIHAASSVNGIVLGRDCVNAVQRCLAANGCGYADAFREPMLDALSDENTEQLIRWLANDRNISVRDKASDVLTSFFSYMGVAITPCTSGPRGGALQRQGYSATRGGLMTIVNTGTTALRPGDRVRMVIDVLDVAQGRRLANDHITGIPHTKVVARLAHVQPDSRHFADLAAGITSREIGMKLMEPTVLIPRLEYVGRERFPCDWRHGGVAVPRPMDPRLYAILPPGIGPGVDALANQVAAGGNLFTAMPANDGDLAAGYAVINDGAGLLAAAAAVNGYVQAMAIIAATGDQDGTIGGVTLLIIRSIEVCVAVEGDLSDEAANARTTAHQHIEDFCQYILNELAAHIMYAQVIREFAPAGVYPASTSQLLGLANALYRLHRYRTEDLARYAQDNAALAGLHAAATRVHAWTALQRTQQRQANRAYVQMVFAGAAPGGNTFGAYNLPGVANATVDGITRAQQAARASYNATFEPKRGQSLEGGVGRGTRGTGVCPAVIAAIQVRA